MVPRIINHLKSTMIRKLRRLFHHLPRQRRDQMFSAATLKRSDLTHCSNRWPWKKNFWTAPCPSTCQRNKSMSPSLWKMWQSQVVVSLTITQSLPLSWWRTVRCDTDNKKLLQVIIKRLIATKARGSCSIHLVTSNQVIWQFRWIIFDQKRISSTLAWMQLRIWWIIHSIWLNMLWQVTRLIRPSPQVSPRKTWLKYLWINGRLTT